MVNYWERDWMLIWSDSYIHIDVIIHYLGIKIGVGAMLLGYDQLNFRFSDLLNFRHTVQPLYHKFNLIFVSWQIVI